MSQENKKITLNIGGMSCINCSLSIEKALSKLNGVTHATVNFAAEKAIIEYSPDLVDQKTIENTITESGYRVIHEKIVLQIGGMSCVNCAQSIEKALNSKEGVYNATVNFATEKVTVEYNPEQLSLAGIKKTIQDVGYQIIEAEKTVQDAEGKERQTTHSTSKNPFDSEHCIDYSDYPLDVVPRFTNATKQHFVIYLGDSRPIYCRMDLLRWRIQGLKKQNRQHGYFNCHGDIHRLAI